MFKRNVILKPQFLPVYIANMKLIRRPFPRRRFEYLGGVKLDLRLNITITIYSKLLSDKYYLNFVKMDIENVLVKPPIRNAFLIYRVITLSQSQLHKTGGIFLDILIERSILDSGNFDRSQLTTWIHKYKNNIMYIYIIPIFILFFIHE